jgi:glycyl-tRNA synthetase
MRGHEKTKVMEKIASLARRRGFVYPSSGIYGGLAGVWDYGPLGVLLKNNIKNFWWKTFVLQRDDIYGLDAAILMNAKVWRSSGHLAGFSDPLVECKECHHRFRGDKVKNGGGGCPECGGDLTAERQFNTMFKTFIGAVEDTASEIYLRPETAQGIFVNFKNIVDSFHPSLPFGIAQIGKAFRNEITPGGFLFRIREFEQMEIEYFIRPPQTDQQWQEVFNYWRKEIHDWLFKIGLRREALSDYEVPPKDLAHYSKRTIDVFYKFPFGNDEIVGLAYRTDFDLKAHQLDYYDRESKQRIVPHVIEPSFGLDRPLFALLCEAYDEDEAAGEKRIVLRFKPGVAPIKAAVFPLLKNKADLVEKAKEIYEKIKTKIQPVVFDDDDNIGKRYRRQDEIGTPFCITIDFETLKDDSVTIRDRDTAKQVRLNGKDILLYLRERLAF